MTDTYRDTIKQLSDRIVEAQRPIKVLSTINWDDSIKEKFFATEFKELPAIDRAYYESARHQARSRRDPQRVAGIEADLQSDLARYLRPAI